MNLTLKVHFSTALAQELYVQQLCLRKIAQLLDKQEAIMFVFATFSYSPQTFLPFDNPHFQRGVDFQRFEMTSRVYRCEMRLLDAVDTYNLEPYN